MLVYEVDIDLDAPLRERYLAWLEEHVREILSLPGFTGARVFEVCEPPAAAGRIALCVQYALRDAAALERYLREDAPRLRADGLARFGGRFTATRRVLRSLEPGPEAAA